MSNGTFDFNAFIAESKETLLNPKSYFSAMKTSGGITDPLIKAVIYGTVSGIIALLWWVVGLGGVSFVGSAIGFMALITLIIASVVGVFVGAVILLIISSISNGNSDFEANLRVSASLLVIMPISSLFGFTSHLSPYFGLVINLLVSAYLLWLLYNGLVEALKCNAATAKIVCYVLIGVMVLFLLLGLSVRKKYMGTYPMGTSELYMEIPK
jgi:hypothetical protein